MVRTAAVPGTGCRTVPGAKPLSVARRSYAYCLRTVVSDLGADTNLSDVSSEGLRHVLEQRWGSAAPATWNSRLAALGSFYRWAEAQGWVRVDLLAGIERRPRPRDEVAPIRYEQLHALWTGRISMFARKPCAGWCTRPRPGPTRY